MNKLIRFPLAETVLILATCNVSASTYHVSDYGKSVRGVWFHGNFVAQSDIFAYNNTCYGLHGTQWNQAVAAYNRERSYTNMVFKNNLSDTDTFINGTDMQANSFE